MGYDDACTNPTDFTVDKRCYVTEEQKKKNPYNAVVSFLYASGEAKPCTGTIVKRSSLSKNNKKYFLYTAKHCSDLDFDNYPDSILRIRLQDGRDFDASLINQGNYNIQNGQNLFGDWVEYEILIKDENVIMPYVEINDGLKKDMKKAQVVGYGRLKIMSDKEINDAIEIYAKAIEGFSTTEKNEDGTAKRNQQNGFLDNDVISGPKVVMIFDSLFSTYLDWELKKSDCQYAADGFTHNCQGWAGNSGGPIFDEDGKIMGILVRGNYTIGGTGHAGVTYGIKFKPSEKLDNKR